MDLFFLDFDVLQIYESEHHNISSRRKMKNCNCPNKTMTMIELCYRDLKENGIEKD